MLRRRTKGSHFFDTETCRPYAVVTRSNPKSINQWRIQGRGPEGPGLLLFLDQTEARRGEKKFFETGLPLISGSGWPGSPSSEGMELPETLINFASLGLKRNYFQHNFYLLILASNSRSESKLPSSISFTRRCQFFSSSRKPLYVYTAKYENIVPMLRSFKPNSKWT